MHALIDGDVLTYKCGFAAEKSVWLAPSGQVFDNPTHAKKNGVAKEDLERIVDAEPVENAIHNVKQAVGRCVEDTQADALTICLSGDSNFREDIAVVRPYKGNRDPDHKPFHYDAIREYLSTQYPSVITENEEADDFMGYQQYNKDKYDDTVICTIDKDLDMIPGHHYNLNTEELYFIDPWEADKVFYRQMLTGDATDNIVGVPGVGKVGAKKIVPESLEPKMRCAATQAIEEAYQRAYADDKRGWRHVLLEMGQLLWIRREPNQFWEPWMESKSA